MGVVDRLVEVRLRTPEDFLKIKETLTRIGVASKHEKVLYQSCHILHKQGRYYIPHFKQMFELDGKPSNFSEDDHGRLNTIVALLAEWGLVDVMDETSIRSPRCPVTRIKILSHREKGEWVLESKYQIGRTRPR